MNRSVIADLAERVGRATGPDRELDRGIYDAFCPETIDEGWFWLLAREYTASIDAALALVERVLPGWKVGTASADPTRPPIHDKAWAKIEPYLTNDAGWKVGARDAYAATVPLAILAALLSALSDDGGHHAES